MDQCEVFFKKKGLIVYWTNLILGFKSILEVSFSPFIACFPGLMFTKLRVLDLNQQNSQATEESSFP